ncbi:hypothetical protein EVAR_25665_1 [Eumeta japonica]|uniref:Uncharacterized protein n=1 Tax=Eumeta variegata TaxID=151549 RepID=A0A4C1WEA0_EUMVA|nr:hypothetical protein EVAR_25665_1 [Eumeta japonica]
MAGRDRRYGSVSGRHGERSRVTVVENLLRKQQEINPARVGRVEIARRLAARPRRPPPPRPPATFTPRCTFLRTTRAVV